VAEGTVELLPPRQRGFPGLGHLLVAEAPGLDGPGAHAGALDLGLESLQRSGYGDGCITRLAEGIVERLQRRVDLSAGRFGEDHVFALDLLLQTLKLFLQLI